jgi:ATP-dependent exoDNAse (exonuclease V) beta subunit
MSWFRRRAGLRERFESMRLLYVAATRSRDRLILSGAAKDLIAGKENWLTWISEALGLNGNTESRVLTVDEKTQVNLSFNILDDPTFASIHKRNPSEKPVEWNSIDKSFRLMEGVEPDRRRIHRLSVTQLVNYRRCPRQYYLDRVLNTPADDEIAIWNSAEAPEPPANLRATLKGAVIHRFCERFSDVENFEACLRASLNDILREREAELAGRLAEIDMEKAIRELEPLAKNYLSSNVRQRIEAARQSEQGELSAFSERRFQLRRPLGIVTGTIDKLLVLGSKDRTDGLTVEIVDFKTNRFNKQSHNRSRRIPNEQFYQQSFDFLKEHTAPSLLDRSEVEELAIGYEIQMQTYALAVRQIMPEAKQIKVTLHFLDPDIEVSLPDRLLEPEVCARAIDDAMMGVISSVLPDSAPVNPGHGCRICSFLEICQSGRSYLASRRPNLSSSA